MTKLSSSEQLDFFERAIFQSTGVEEKVVSFEFVSGGCINNAVRVNTDHRIFFIKWNVHELSDMFEAEARGLELLRESGEIYIPEVIGWGKKEERSYLILEFIQSASPQQNFWEDFGKSLAQLHHHQHHSFGLDFDNYIGALPQQNPWEKDGIVFFVEQRLRPQAGKAMYENKLSPNLYQDLEQLYGKLPDLLPQETPCLLHGDLWSGNFMVNHEGRVALIDPAVYYGNREAELAFTQLFGGFDEHFYRTYREVYPLEEGFEERVGIYNLYPLLVHVNLFGAGYLSGIRKVLKKYL